MISVEEASRRILSVFAPLSGERIALENAAGCILAADAHAAADQPPYPVSMMDGYAVRSADTGPRRLIGSAPAGRPFVGALGAGETVRLFTGSVVPDGSDAVLAQEDAIAEGDVVRFTETPHPGKFIRLKGLDFRAGETLLPKGRRLAARDLALLAAGDLATVDVVRRPVIAFAATGDELSRPGEPRKPGGIVSSSVYGLSALIAQWGGIPRDLGILPDRAEVIAQLAEEKCDLLVTLGGASVGDHDLIQTALGSRGLALDFWKIAMRPGKPLIFGRLGETPFLGLPGNPVSTLVCATLFLRPAIAAMLGAATDTPLLRGRLGGALKANDQRQDYLRARSEWRDGERWAHPLPKQDSSMLKAFSEADALIVRAPYASVLAEGADIDLLMLE
ncbi:MAG TPA: gephyrin-like molybdotransferase Glp [Rhizomicrobium sp.]